LLFESTRQFFLTGHQVWSLLDRLSWSKDDCNGYKDYFFIVIRKTHSEREVSENQGLKMMELGWRNYVVFVVKLCCKVGWIML